MKTKGKSNTGLTGKTVKVLVLTASLLPMAAWSATTKRVNLDDNGNEANFGGYDEFNASVSANGRYVAFSSKSTNLVPGQYAAGQANAFIRDIAKNKIIRVIDQGYDGQQFWRTDGHSYMPTHVFAAGISGDGRYVALQSDAGNIVPGVAGYWTSVFVRELRTGATETVCYDTNNVINDKCAFGGISQDGRYVAFTLYKASSYTIPYVRDRLLGTTERLDIDVDGNPLVGISSTPHGMSADGRYVLFSSYGSTLVQNDTNDMPDLFVRDRVLGVTTRVNVASDGTQSNGGLNVGYRNSAISADGHTVAFVASATNLVPNGYLGNNVYVHDIETGETEQADVRLNPYYTSYAQRVSLSGDGRYVAFSNQVSNLVPGDTNGAVDAFVYDKVDKVIERVSVSNAGAQAQAGGYFQDMSQDGSRMVFQSDSTNLVDLDLNEKRDLFVRSICRVGN